jgi:sensor c-di-GMP phosphodiesterase-like protein
MSSGWYQDPEDEQRLRYWDGGQWTQHVHTPDRAAAAVIARASNLRTASIVVAVLLWLPIGVFCGIAGAMMSKRARVAAERGDASYATRLLNRVQALLIVNLVVFVIWWAAFTVYFVAGGPS